MKSRLIELFFDSAGVLLLLTGAAKLVSVTGISRSLEAHDPILGIAFSQIFLLVGVVELVVGVICLIGKKRKMQAIFVAALATNFLLYRLCLYLVGYEGPCGCLGDFTERLHIPAAGADIALKIVLLYLLIGSYSALVSLSRRSPKVSPYCAIEAPNSSAAT